MHRLAADPARLVALFLLALAVACIPVNRADAQLASDARSGFAVIMSAPGNDASTTALDPLQQPAKRRSEGGRVALQFLAASAGAAGGGISAFLLLRDAGTTRVSGDAGYTRAGNVGYLVGSMAGATLGAHVVGTSMGARSPVWATALGALVGTAPLLTLGIDEPYLPLVGIALGWIPQAALATGGFNLGVSRKE